MGGPGSYPGARGASTQTRNSSSQLADTASVWYQAFLSVLVHFKCQLDWATGHPDSWVNLISGCVCGGVWDESNLSLDSLSEE